MTNDPSDSELISDLANEYLERCRTGPRPPLKEYVDRYPHLKEQIHEVFPMMLLMEDNAPPAPPPTESGSAIPDQLGDFRILREIGRGGMGVVYEAMQISLGRHVALKVCPLGAQMNPRSRERFRRESRAAAMMHHTNIVPVFAVGEENGMLYYAMQYIRGATLNEVIVELKPLLNVGNTSVVSNVDAASVAQSLVQSATLEAPSGATSSTKGLVATTNIVSASENSGPADLSRVSLPGQKSGVSNTTASGDYWRSVAQIGVQITEALDYAHGTNTLHRDIKPANLMIDYHGTVWVMDFGLAKSMEEEDLTMTGEMVGTLRYMAPRTDQRKTVVRK